MALPDSLEWYESIADKLSVVLSESNNPGDHLYAPEAMRELIEEVRMLRAEGELPDVARRGG